MTREYYQLRWAKKLRASLFFRIVDRTAGRWQLIHFEWEKHLDASTNKIRYLVRLGWKRIPCYDYRVRFGNGAVRRGNWFSAMTFTDLCLLAWFYLTSRRAKTGENK